MEKKPLRKTGISFESVVVIRDRKNAWNQEFPVRNYLIVGGAALMPKADKSDFYSIAMVSHSPGGRLEHAHEHLHLSCGGVYLRRLGGVGNCRLNRGKRSFRSNGRERGRRA